MANQKQKYERKSIAFTISISPYLDLQLQELVDRGLFSTKSDAIKHAIHEMIARMETQGKLKPIPVTESATAEEKITVEKKLEKIDEGEID